jgi:hypothetical protein
MVPRQQLDAAREAAAQAELETARLRERLARMVPRSDLLPLEADNGRLAAEVERLSRAMEGTVPRAQYQAAQERLDAALAASRAGSEGMRRLVVAAAAVAAAAEAPGAPLMPVIADTSHH